MQILVIIDCTEIDETTTPMKHNSSARWENKPMDADF
jgi:hypothetical protein